MSWKLRTSRTGLLGGKDEGPAGVVTAAELRVQQAHLDAGCGSVRRPPPEGLTTQRYRQAQSNADLSVGSAMRRK
jgi:hypothetical protein